VYFSPMRCAQLELFNSQRSNLVAILEPERVV
jgi:hypothetical protein